MSNLTNRVQGTRFYPLKSSQAESISIGNQVFHTRVPEAETQILHEPKARWKQTSYMNPDPTPYSEPNLPTIANPRPLIFSKNNKPRWIQRDNVIPRVERILFGLWSFQEVAARLLLPHAFGFSVWFPPSLCFSSNSLFFLSGLDLMMLH